MVKSIKRINYKKSSKCGKKSKKPIKQKSLRRIKKGYKSNRKITLFKKKSRGMRGGMRGRRRGGNCGCGMKGGMISSPASGPIGTPWSGSDDKPVINTQGITMSNHFKVSPNGVVVGGIDPYGGSSGIIGGKSKRKSKRKSKCNCNGKCNCKGKGKKQKGGFFQEIVNLGRGVQYGLNSGYFNLVGKQQPISQNPYPTESQPIDNDYKYIGLRS